ncbi:YhgE/Pip domain-containing protein [Bhargavaea beijingensis]|uniref:YhgE/Pip domain-containing protein n=1 Tax=Bhargavaea beijingensis TaxID=426756 RepID=UPI0022251F59|nr:YhgE/Pip domain-containing protein [Bhargavaea beijingensis]MCW1929137.1 YhgE/Pip domain-containing protein [Bhargavaea beijingensis]
MKQVWKIFSTDIVNLSKNWVAAILVGGLVFLPSLYAWFNIYASWDPYGNTDRLPVAVVNEDQGATVRDDEIDVGSQLVDSLKENDTINWKFTERKDALKRVENGEYFAAIIVPEDFSEKLATVTSGHPQKATMEYYVNEKTNSIAPKITEKGASAIVETVSKEFTSTVNSVIFDMFNKLGIELQTDLPDIEKFEQYVFSMEEKLPGVQKLLESVLNDADQAQALLSQAEQKMPEAKRLTAEGLSTVNQTLGYLDTAEQQLAALEPQIEKDLETAARVSGEINDMLLEIQKAALDTTQLDTAKSGLDDKMTEAIQSVDNIQKQLLLLKEINQDASETPVPEADQEEAPTLPEEDLQGRQTESSAAGQSAIDNAIQTTGQLKSALQEAQDNARAVEEAAAGYVEQAKGWVNDVQGIAQNVSVSIDSYTKTYNETIKPTIQKEIKDARSTLAEARDLLSGIQATLPEAEKIITSTSGHLSEGEQGIEEALNQYPYVYTKITELADRIRSVQGETDINEIIDLLLNDPEAEKSFFEEPILLHENKLFPIENYGTGMTPFYTVLSIWVGCLLLVSLLSTDIHHAEQFSQKTVYFGRLLLFLLIGVLQSLIVTIGNILVLGVDVAEPLGFVLSGLLISTVFMTIVYTLVSVFGDVGKAMAIVLLVLQIAGSGGTYPVVLLPDFFQMISPYLPFTYAIDLMREMTGGVVQARIAKDIPILVGIGAAMMVFGSFLKPILNKWMNQILKKSRESGLFH